MDSFAGRARAPGRARSAVVACARIAPLVLVVACAGSPRRPEGSAAPLRRVLLFPLNVVVTLPTEVESGVGAVSEELRAYLEAHGLSVESVELVEAREAWLRSALALKAEVGPEKMSFEGAARTLARQLRGKRSFDALIVPWIAMRSARMQGGTVSWDGIRRKVEFVGSDEGFADVLSTVRRREYLVDVGAPRSGRAIELARRGSFDLAAIFEPETYAEAGDIPRFYAGAWATVHYLSASEERGAQLERFLELVVSGVPWREAYPQAFDVPLAELSRRVRAHGAALAGGAPFSLKILDARALAAEGGGEARALRPADAAAALGEFWLGLTSTEEDDAELVAFARAFFERSLAIGPEQARARAGLAVCRARQGGLAEARRDAALALAMAPADARVQIRAGEVELVRARDLADAGDAAGAAEARRAARAASLRATELAPDDPVAWAGVGASFVGADGDVGPGIDALLRARELGAWAAGPNLDLAQLYAAAGQRERARETLREVARMDEGAAGERAAELLDELAASEPDRSASTP